MNSTYYNIVLSGGGARGYAHIGILQALNEKNILPSAISGTSAGALVGVLIADGYTPEEIRQIIIKEEPSLSINYFGFTNGFFSADSIHGLLERNLRSKTFKDLRIPFYVSVTNLLNGENEIISEGDLIDVLIASSSIPVLFPTVFINQTPYADGGITNNLPIEPFIGSARKIIACHVNPLSPFQLGISTAENIDRSMHMALRTQLKDKLQYCDQFIEPTQLHQFDLLETKKVAEIIQMGYDDVSLRSFN